MRCDGLGDDFDRIGFNRGWLGVKRRWHERRLVVIGWLDDRLNRWLNRTFLYRRRCRFDGRHRLDDAKIGADKILGRCRYNVADGFGSGSG